MTYPQIVRGLAPLPHTAYHEAGHAVVAAILGIRFQATVAMYISYDINNSTSGHLRVLNEGETHTAIDQDTGGFLPGSNRDIWHQRKILVSYAGIKAECRFTEKEDWIGASHDMETARRMITCITTSEAEAQALLRWLELRAEAMVADTATWRAIERVAAQLLEDQIVLEIEVQTAYEQAIKELAIEQAAS